MKPNRKDKLILDMLETMYALAWNCGRMARLSARDFYEHYRRKVRRLGLKPKED